MSAKFAFIACLAAGVLVASFGPQPSPASAEPVKFVRCLANRLSVSAEGHGILGVNARVTQVAINNWQSAAAQQIGPFYGSWGNALGGTVECKRGIFKVVCIATATPCRS